MAVGHYALSIWRIGAGMTGKQSVCLSSSASSSRIEVVGVEQFEGSGKKVRRIFTPQNAPTAFEVQGPSNHVEPVPEHHSQDMLPGFAMLGNMKYSYIRPAARLAAMSLGIILFQASNHGSPWAWTAWPAPAPT
jgi:hypothetical protein